MGCKEWISFILRHMYQIAQVCYRCIGSTALSFSWNSSASESFLIDRNQKEAELMTYIPTSFPKASFKKLYRKYLNFIAVCWVLVLNADDQIRTEFNIVNEFPFSSSSVETVLLISKFLHQHFCPVSPIPFIQGTIQLYWKLP